MRPSRIAPRRLSRPPRSAFAGAALAFGLFPSRAAAAETCPPAGPATVRFRTDKRGRLDRARRPGGPLVFDRRGDDRYYDVWIEETPGAPARCLTCDHPDLPGKHAGQPALHPSGRWMVFQAEKGDRPPTLTPIGKYLASNPGAGVYNDLWVMALATGEVYRLTDLPVDRNHGVLHPHFSRDGRRLAWSQMYRRAGLFARNSRKGWWRLHVAEFRDDGGVPRLESNRVFEQDRPGMMENHGFTPDGKGLLYQGNQAADASRQWTDIWRLDLTTGAHSRLTHSDFNEHAHYSPDGSAIVWTSSRDNANGGLDWWWMTADGGCRRRLTFFNRPGHPHYKGHKILAADLSWRADGSGFTGYWHDYDLATLFSKDRLGEGHAEVTLGPAGVSDQGEEPAVSEPTRPPRNPAAKLAGGRPGRVDQARNPVSEPTHPPRDADGEARR